MTQRDDINFDASRAVLLAISTYKPGSRDLTAMPAASRSMAELRELLIDTCEWPGERITPLPAEYHGGLLRKITKLIEDVEDVLLFYYVGHGLPIHQDGRYDLGLALADTDEAVSLRGSTSLRLRDLREQMEASRARVKILILDCCNAGIATRYVEQSGGGRGGGTYIWAACGHAQKTYFEEKTNGLTYFTKFLAEAVRDARELPPPGVDLAVLNDDVAARLDAISEDAGFIDTPKPQVYHSGRPDGFRLVRSRGTANFVPPHQYEKLDAGDPREIGLYTLRARLGVGGVGRVYLATGKRGELVAVKILHPEYAHDPEFASLFAAESLVARKIRSPFVARILDAEAAADKPWLAMEYVCGPSLHELATQVRPLAPRDILKIAAGVAQGLEAVHANNTVHRDLKPANIMIDDTGPKIIDFGIAKSIAATKATTTHRNLGTPAYRSPEQIMGKQATGKSDIFSLGSTLYFLATGKNAFQPEEEGDLFAYTHLICSTEPDLSGIDGDVRRLIEACLAKDPEQRPDPGELLDMCLTALDGLATGAPLPIDAAGGLIRARAQALRALLTSPVEPTIRVKPSDSGEGGKNEGDGGKNPGGDGRKTARGVRAVLAVAVAIIVVGALGWLLGDRHSIIGTTAGGSSSSPITAQSPTTANDTTDPGSPTIQTSPPQPVDTTTSPQTTQPTPTAAVTTSSASDSLASAQVGECFVNNGSFASPQLQEASCTPFIFKVAAVFTGTTDASVCSNTQNVDYTVSHSDGSDNLVLCLTYLEVSDTNTTVSAYHATPGTCVLGPLGSDKIWIENNCVAGAYRVIARLGGTTDTSRCGAYPNINYLRGYTTQYSQLDVVLCLSDY